MGVPRRRRHGPHGRLPGTFPTDQHGAGRGGIAEAVVVHAHQLSGLAVTHPPAGQGGRELLGGSDGPLAPLGVVRQDAQGKDREVGLGDDEHAVTRTPYLDKRRILPCGGAGARDARMDRQQRASRNSIEFGTPPRLVLRLVLAGLCLALGGSGSHAPVHPCRTTAFASALGPRKTHARLARTPRSPPRTRSAPCPFPLRRTLPPGRTPMSAARAPWPTRGRAGSAL